MDYNYLPEDILFVIAGYSDSVSRRWIALSCKFMYVRALQNNVKYAPGYFAEYKQLSRQYSGSECLRSAKKYDRLLKKMSPEVALLFLSRHPHPTDTQGYRMYELLKTAYPVAQTRSNYIAAKHGNTIIVKCHISQYGKLYSRSSHIYTYPITALAHGQTDTYEYYVSQAKDAFCKNVYPAPGEYLLARNTGMVEVLIDYLQIITGSNAYWQKYAFDKPTTRYLLGVDGLYQLYHGDYYTDSALEVMLENVDKYKDTLTLIYHQANTNLREHLQKIQGNPAATKFYIGLLLDETNAKKTLENDLLEAIKQMQNLYSTFAIAMEKLGEHILRRFPEPTEKMIKYVLVYCPCYTAMPAREKLNIILDTIGYRSRATISDLHDKLYAIVMLYRETRPDKTNHLQVVLGKIRRKRCWRNGEHDLLEGAAPGLLYGASLSQLTLSDLLYLLVILWGCSQDAKKYNLDEIVGRLKYLLSCSGQPLGPVEQIYLSHVKQILSGCDQIYYLPF